MEEIIVNAVQFLVGLLHLKVELVAAIFGALFFVSEILASVKGVASNGVFQVIKNVIKKLAGK
jgi:uncharacterized membrane protein YuzA (DUF378 family)